MKRKEWQSLLMTYLLVGLLGIMSIMMIKSIINYYGSPVYKVDCYLRYLNTRQYNKIPQLLSKESIAEFKSQEEISHYYNKRYNEENKLVSVVVKNYEPACYTLEYTYTNKKEKDVISLIKEGNRWRIKFPFKREEVTIFAPYGSKVYLDSELLSYNRQDGNYKAKDILPGNYLLKVCFEKEGYNDYYKMLNLPKEKSYIIPYNMAYVEINCPSHLQVTLGHFVKESVNHKVTFKDILQEEYGLCIEDKNGFIEPQTMHIGLGKGKNQFDIKEFTLTEKGKQQLSEFIKQFYSQYVEAISCHSHEKIDCYFEGKNKQEQLELFDDWYIKDKDISHVIMNLKIGDYVMDDAGELHIMLREVSSLTNEEENEGTGEEVERQYRVLLDFEVTLNILEGDWRITNRKMIQSLVAVKDQTGKWVQY